MDDEYKRKKKKQTEQLALNAIREEIHIFDGPNGKADADRACKRYEQRTVGPHVR